jgi:hypothetical protein
VGPIAKSAPVLIARAAPPKSTEPCAARRARTSIGPARREVRGATLEAVCGVTQQGADGPTRRSSSVIRGVLDRATANSLAAGHHGRLQDDRAVKTRLLTRSCLRGLDQGLGATRACSSRNRPLEPLCTIAWLVQGWAGHPCSMRPLRLTSTRTPAQVVDAPRFVTRWANSEMLESPHIARSFTNALPVVPQPIEQDPVHSAVPVRDGRPISLSPNSVINTKGQAFRRQTTMSNDL